MRQNNLLRPSLLVLCALTVITAGLATASPSTSVEWPLARPAERNLDPARLGTLIRAIEAGKTPIHSLLILRHGDLVLEEYFDGWNADRLHTLQSVSKSFTSALIGIAIEQGKIRGVEEKVLGFFPQRQDIQKVDERKRAMTLEDLLTMRSGTDYHESPYSGSPHNALNNLSRGWDRFYLDRPMKSRPGTTFLYDSGGVILMSSLLKARTGLHADAFAERYLFKPLGIRHSNWSGNAEGHPHTGGGLHLRPRDMAKLGQLYLQGGRWNGQQVVPADWVATSVRRHVQRQRGHEVGYGYLWWILEPDPNGTGEQDIYAAMGFMGQYIFVVPEHDMVVVVTAGARGADQNRPIDFLYTHILPAVRGTT